VIELSDETVGTYFIDEHGDIWQHIAYTDRPTAALQRVGNGERRSGVVGAAIFDGFTPLVEKREP
jgi:hypothetical protein